MKTIFEGKIFTIPNALTVLRILLIPVLFWAYLGRQDPVLTAVILLLSGLTDVLDGFIARRFDMISNLGKALDPLADKLTQVSLFACLMVNFPIMLWVLVVLVIKEIFVFSTHYVVVKRTGQLFCARWHGKATTVLLSFTMVLHLLWAKIPGWLSTALIVLCICMILLSGILYGIQYFQALSAFNKQKKQQ